MGRELQSLNAQNKPALWANRITECRSSGQSVKIWCKENGICEQTYYKWQKRLFQMAQDQREAQFVEITPHRTVTGISVTVQLGDMEAQVHNGADAATVESVLRILKSC